MSEKGDPGTYSIAWQPRCMGGVAASVPSAALAVAIAAESRPPFATAILAARPAAEEHDGEEPVRVSREQLSLPMATRPQP